MLEAGKANPLPDAASAGHIDAFIDGLWLEEGRARAQAARVSGGGDGRRRAAAGALPAHEAAVADDLVRAELERVALRAEGRRRARAAGKGGRARERARASERRGGGAREGGWRAGLTPSRLCVLPPVGATFTVSPGGASCAEAIASARRTP